MNGKNVEGTRVVHLSSVHARHDTRVFLKECRSLASAGCDVTLIVADGLPPETKDGVKIQTVDKPGNRLARIFSTTRRIADRALAMKADIYHLHDPELLLIASRLSRHGKVVFDSHEDVPKQILTKDYLPKALRGVVSWGYGMYERWAAARVDAIVAATPAIRGKFEAINRNVHNINNFPMLGELSSGPVMGDESEAKVCYVGGIDRIRGIVEIVDAMSLTRSGVRLVLGGKFDDEGLAAKVRQLPGWNNVDEVGWLDRKAVARVLGSCRAGLVTFHPSPNHVDAQPNKMFEYMAAGLPVIASGFPLWRELVEGNQCGICVDPLKPGEIAAAIDRLVSSPAEARRMGENGRHAVLTRYNWQQEERNLLDLYSQLMQEKRA